MVKKKSWCGICPWEPEHIHSDSQGKLPSKKRPSQKVYTLRLTQEELAWIFLLLKQELGMKDPLTQKIDEEFYREETKEASS